MRFQLEERIFMVKTFYQSGRKSVIDLWDNEFETEPPSLREINKTVKKFESIGTVQDAPRSGRTRTADTPENRELVATMLVETPTTSSRKGTLQFPNPISRTSFQRIIKKLKIKCYHPRLVHGLIEDDPDRRVEFCELMLNEYRENDRRIFEKIIWTDEAQFKLNGFVNRHNCIYYDTENPKLIYEKQLNQPGLNVWGGFSLNTVYGPYFFENTITANAYLEMLRDYLLPGIKTHEDNFEELYYQHDGAPAHYAVSVREFLDREFDGRIIGRRGQIEWPARSPDLTCMDFYFWGTVKDMVYARKPLTINQLQQFIEDAFDEIAINQIQRRRVIESLEDRYQSCINVEGSQFEHLS